MIGLFDSGSGGLSVLQALRKRKPDADVVYFGDIKHAPYGVREEHELVHLTIDGLRTLRMFGSEEIVSACNTVSPVVLKQGAEGADVIEMTRPAARAMRQYAGGRVLLIATPATVHSRIYESAFGGMVVLHQHPIRDLAGAIEFGAHDDKIREIVRHEFSKRWGESFEHLFLGCTHYPFARRIIEEEAHAVFGSVDILDPADAVAEEAERRFNTRGSGKIYFRVSQDSEHFRRRVGELFPEHEHTIKILPPYGSL
ncbi:MAG: aspartate/glutamate racemase family protein [Patescibacteria group bacterium]